MAFTPERIEKGAADIIRRTHSTRGLGDGKACCKLDVLMIIIRHAKA
jgi:hypothetical protein